MKESICSLMQRIPSFLIQKCIPRLKINYQIIITSHVSGQWSIN